MSFTYNNVFHIIKKVKSSENKINIFIENYKEFYKCTLKTYQSMITLDDIFENINEHTICFDENSIKVKIEYTIGIIKRYFISNMSFKIEQKIFYERNILNAVSIEPYRQIHQIKKGSPAILSQPAVIATWFRVHILLDQCAVNVSIISKDTTHNMICRKKAHDLWIPNSNSISIVCNEDNEFYNAVVIIDAYLI